MEVNDSTMNGEPSTSNTSAVTTDGVSTTRKAEEAAVTPSANKVLYGVEDCPPWYLCAFFSLQVGSFRHAKKISDKIQRICHRHVCQYTCRDVTTGISRRRV